MVLPTSRGDREFQKFVEDTNGNVSIRTFGSPGINSSNTTTTALGSAETYTGTWVDVSGYTSVVVAALADQDGTLYMEFSNTGSGSADSTLTYQVAANINDVHRLTVTRQYYRTRYLNGSSAQSSFEITTIFGNHTALAAPANLTLGQDADATTTRVIEFEQDIAEGKRAGYSVVSKFGRNPDLDTTGLPEDLWAGGGVYTGFPTGAAELCTVVSSSTDDAAAGSGAQTVRLSGLDANGNQQTEDVTLNGTTLVDTTNTWTRVNRVIVLTSGSSNQAFNVGVITVAHKTTTANVFAVVPAGTNQSQVGAYTVPSGYTGYVRRIQVWVKRANTAAIDGALWIRNNGASPRLVDIFSANQSDQYDEEIFGGTKLEALTDFTIRITACSANNTEVTCHFDIILVKN